MPRLETDILRVELDDKGYLANEATWSQALARVLAAEDDIAELTDEHWRIIDFLRAHQKAKGVAPMVRVLCRETGFSLARIYELFPGGPAKSACRVAGLPRPDSCV